MLKIQNTEMKKLNKTQTIRWIFFGLTCFSIVLTATYWLNKETKNILDLNSYSKKLMELKTLRNYDGTSVFAASGEKLFEFKDKFQISLSLEKVPNQFLDMLLHIEDRKFYEHNGVDYFAILRAIVSHLKPGGMKQGGSTISQQVIRSLLLSHEKSFLRKLREFFLAKKLEQKFSKEEILSIYINHMYLGAGTYGIGAAAKKYLNKNIEDLNINEMAFIVGLFQSPNRYNPYRNLKASINRKNTILKSLYKAKKISKNDLSVFLSTIPNFVDSGAISEQKLAPYFVDYIKEQAQTVLKGSINSRGYKIFTTLDYSIQKIAETNLIQANSKLNSLETKTKERADKKNNYDIESSILITDTKDGKILAMIGGRSYEKSQFNRVTKSLRSPGSAFKPILYALAIENNAKWSDRLYIDPIRIDTYTPKNMNQGFFQETTLLKSFYASLNTPTIELSEQMGISNLISFAKKLGVESPLKKESGTAIGSSEVSFFDLARVYGSFANKGLRTNLHAITKIEDLDGNVLFEFKSEPPISTMKPTTASLMVEGFRGVMLHGTAARSADISSIAIGKTGTSNQSTDNWFCGFTTQHTILTWVGSDSNSALPITATGTSLALPIFDNIVRDLDAKFSLEEIKTDDELVSIKIHPEFGTVDEDKGINMYFDPDNLPSPKSSALKDIKNLGSFRRIFE